MKVGHLYNCLISNYLHKILFVVMAYALCAESQLKSKSVQYYPEEYDYPAYSRKSSELKNNYLPPQNAKKGKSVMPATNTGERKCPIYVHQYNKIQSTSTYNNYPSRISNKSSTERHFSSKTRKIPTTPITTKSVLDQLEETYWATWKPNKENVGSKSRKNRGDDDRMNKNKAYGDVSETLVNYFARAEFNTSTASVVEDTDSEKYSRKLESKTKKPDTTDSRKKRRTPEVTTNTREIQTDICPLILPKIDEHNENNVQVVGVAKTENTEAEVNNVDSEELDENSKTEEKSKLLRHTDSFIINKKKQSEVKEHFQQPKCIRLYKKPGVSNSFIKGGSYPLKPCLKREPVQKGNFRLGAPGSPLIVTTSSYNKKTRK